LRLPRFIETLSRHHGRKGGRREGIPHEGGYVERREYGKGKWGAIPERRDPSPSGSEGVGKMFINQGLSLRRYGRGEGDGAAARARMTILNA